MQTARWTLPVMVATMVAGTAWTLVTPITGAVAASRPAIAAGSVTVGSVTAGSVTAGLTRTAATGRAPLVTGQVRHRHSKRGLPAPLTSRAMRLANETRQGQARRYLRHARPPAARDLAATQRAQITNYFCGPATVTEMLAQMHIVLSQRAAARALGTTRNGTDWSNSHGYPLPRVLNSHQKRNKYVAVGLPWSPTAAQIAVLRMDLVRDISQRRGVPIAGAAYEVPGGPHLVGHPSGQTIMHWFDIRGYSRSGAVIDYEDSVHGASSIGWSAAVPGYAALPTATIAGILGARGYVW